VRLPKARGRVALGGRDSYGTITNVTTVTPELRAAFHKVGKSYERYIDWPARIAEYRES
jgi:hypothetical protein